MKFRQPAFSNGKSLKIKEIGGIVTSQHKSAVGLDRLSGGENVWNRDSVLASRFGIAVTKNGIISDSSSAADTNKIFYADFPFDAVPGYNRLCALVKETDFIRTDIDFFVTDSKGAVHYLTLLELVGANGETSFEVKNILFIKDKPLKGSGIFILIPIRRYEGPTSAESKEVHYYELNSDFNALISVKPEDFYRPLIIKHGFGNAVPAEITKACTTSYPEGVNILGGSFEACFTTDGASYSFKLPTSVAQDAPAEIRMYTSDSAYITFTVPANASACEPVSFMQNSITVYLNRSTGEILFYCGSETYGVPAMISDNALRVYSRADTSAAAYELLSRNTRPISFDNRIFFPGGENRGNKIYFSGKNQPLYYSEKNYIPVGNNNYDLTALSLQSKYVIAFKERELYRLSLSESKEIDRDSLLYDNSLLEMPVPGCKTTRINDSIGCDLPSTIVNCANRLVWFHSDGAVYTLYGSNLYTEGSVYELSGDITDRLKNLKEGVLNCIFASELGGFYVLGIDDRMFIMDTRVSGFRYLSGHKAANKGYSGLPWFIWKAPKGTRFVSAFTCGGNEYFLLRTLDNRIFYVAAFEDEMDIVPDINTGTAESLPEFSLSTSVFGDSLMYGQRLTVNAVLKNSTELELFDENGIFKSAHITGAERLKSFIIPLSYKKGSIGITIKGSGRFFLKDITYDCCERKY